MVYLVFYLVKDHYRWLVLLIASYGYYASFRAPHLLFILALVTMISYICGIRLKKAEDENRRNLIFWFGVVSCVLLLAAIKCLPLIFLSNANSQLPDIMISVGVSFFTFQAISYLADIYLEIQDPEVHLGYHALSLAFFPKLLQGPIERAGNILPQLKESYKFDYFTIRSGMLLFLWGLFKKVVIADRLSLYVNYVYNNVHDFTGLPLIIATYAYALQIYFDFAGYTDMARGTARIFGINLTENFNSPYLAVSIADFWRRWHISFSRWILDYIFKPLQMTWRNSGQAGTALALIVTFILSGLWHGVTWGFIVWGLLHGVYLATSVYYKPYQKKLHSLLGLTRKDWLKAWQVFITFNLVSFSWIFFRAESVRDAFYIVTNLFDFGHNNAIWYPSGIKEYVKCYVLLGQDKNSIAILIISMIIINMRKFILDRTLSYDNSLFIRWSIYYALLAFIVVFGSYDNTIFIYNQF
jgi:D-alanyl-lipoteichoic acid acyltransferase DltB (MBOAT superfamily)